MAIQVDWTQSKLDGFMAVHYVHDSAVIWPLSERSDCLVMMKCPPQPQASTTFGDLLHSSHAGRNKLLLNLRAKHFAD